MSVELLGLRVSSVGVVSVVVVLLVTVTRGLAILGTTG